MKTKMIPAQMGAVMEEQEILQLITRYANDNIEEPWTVDTVELLHNSASHKTDGSKSTVSARIKFRDKRLPQPERGGEFDR